ncbi:hypothetical protein [Bacillus solimangrovi]|uniref:hypothetical protein n=1 Tax=Bacillus solimangrovi TaxID=1305675 RepID=UPI001585ED3D|nr:hypothetical protein [Bacillus solimangrovi]
MPEKDEFEVVKRVQALLNSLQGNTNIYNPHYVDSVKERLPEIEQAFQSLKNYFEK